MRSISLVTFSLATFLIVFVGCSARRPVATDLPALAPIQPKAVEQMPGDEPDKAAEFFVMKRAGEGVKDLPYERYEAARRRVARMPLAARKKVEAIDLGGWEALGPGNQGGRTRHLIIDPRDPKIMYAGAVTGGVWKTINGGENWTPLTDSFPALGIGALSFEPTNPDTIYAGTGFWFNTLSSTNLLGSAPRGGGIFRTRDAGANWEKLPGTESSQFRYVNEIFVSRNDVNRIYVATWTGIFRSLDGGQNWTQVVNRGRIGENGCQDMVMRTDQSKDYLFASCGTTVTSNPVILRNTDAAGDEAWQTVYVNRAMGNTTLAIAPSNQSMIYALITSNGDDSAEWRNSLLGVWRSTTNGDVDTWEGRVTNEDPIALNTSILSSNSTFFTNVCGTGARSISGQGWIHNAIAVDPQDPERVFVGGIDLYRSDDGGRNWGIASFWQAADGANGAHADVHAIVFPPDFDGDKKPNVYAATDGGVYISENARAQLATGTRAACTPFSNLVRWRPLHGGYQSTQFYSGAVTPGGGSFFGGKQDNGTMRGTLASKGTWTRIRGGDGAAVALDRRNPNTLFVSVQNFGLTRSRNGGRTLTTTLRGINEPSTNFAFIAPLAMDASNSDRLFAGARIIYRTVDQADNWVPVSTQMTTAQGYVSAIAIAPSDATRVVYATSQGFLFTTANALEADAATEWQQTRPRPGYIPAVAFDPQNADVVYAVYSQFNSAAGQNHVYRSTDGGRTWTGIDREGDTGVPDIPVLAVTVDPQDSRRIYLGTDLGVFVSTDGAVSWARDQSPFAAVPTEALVMERGSSATYLYAFTFGRGVWRTLLPGSGGTACEYGIESALETSAFGGDQSLNLTTGEGCVWTAIPDLSGLDILAPATGTGSGRVRVSTALHTGTAARRLGFTVQDKSVSVVQAGASAVPAAADSVTAPAVVLALPYVGVRDSRTATAATSDPTPSCATSPPAKTLWYRVTAPASGMMEVVAQGQRYDVFGNSGLVVSAYSADAELGCAVQARNTGTWIFQSFQFPVTEGVAYLIQASATGIATTDGGFTVIGLRMVN